MDTYVERIDNALRVLRGIEDSDFDLAAWPRCALGHCAKDVWCNDQGFSNSLHAGTIPAFEGASGCAAGAKFFGISQEVSERLFLTGDNATGAYHHGRATRKAVIAHLEVLKLKKLASLQTGNVIEAREFVIAE